nr:DUF1203 domain-containing protein [Mucilaginibacter sp. L294]
MKTFKIVPISRLYAEKIKSTMVDDFNNPVIEQLANGLGPCRVSLKPFKKGVDTRLLFKHSPFDIENAYNQPGPVFINKADVEEYSDIHRFPPGIKANKKSFPLTLIGYNNKQMMVLTETVADKDVDKLITNIFNERADVEYLHARNAQACCFICKIERF